MAGDYSRLLIHRNIAMVYGSKNSMIECCEIKLSYAEVVETGQRRQIEGLVL